MTCPPPLYGTWVMSTPAASLSCSSITCPTVAIPEVARRSDPGFAFAWEIASPKSFPANAGVASRYTGEYITLATGVMSFSGS